MAIPTFGTKNKTTSITHMGSKVTGILRDKWVMGCVEIFEDSSCSAVRANVAADADAMDVDGQEEVNEKFPRPWQAPEDNCATR